MVAPYRHQPAFSWLAFGAAVSVVAVVARHARARLLLPRQHTFSTTYGPLAGMIAILLWAFLSSIAVLFGAAVAAQLEAVRAGAQQPRDEPKAVDADGDAPALPAPH